MRRDTSRPSVSWSAKVSATDKQLLEKLLPTPARWSFTIALTAFVKLMKESPTLRSWAHEEISRGRGDPDDRTTPKVELTFDIPTELYNDFNDLFPQIGATSWFVRRALRAIVAEFAEEPIQRTISRATITGFQP